MHESLNQYRQSGSMGTAVFVVPVVGLIAAFVLAVAYAYADVYIPVAGYISFVLTAVFAAGVGWAVSFAGVKAKCRNVTLMHFLGFVIGLVAVYFSWVAFMYVLLKRELGDQFDGGLGAILLRPDAVWHFANAVGETGWYQLRGGNVKGTFLWVTWALEAVIVVGWVTFMAPMGITGRVFCERCGVWCRKGKDFMRLLVPNNKEFLSRISEGSMEVLAQMPVAPADVSPYLRVDVDRCDTCPDTATWQAVLVTHHRNRQGKLEEKTTNMTAQLLLAPEGLKRLHDLATREPVALRQDAEPTGQDTPGEQDEPVEVDSGESDEVRLGESPGGHAAPGDTPV